MRQHIVTAHAANAAIATLVPIQYAIRSCAQGAGRKIPEQLQMPGAAHIAQPESHTGIQLPCTATNPLLQKQTGCAFSVTKHCAFRPHGGSQIAEQNTLTASCRAPGVVWPARHSPARKLPTQRSAVSPHVP